MKRKIFPLLLLVMLLFGLAGPRPVKAQTGCVEYSTFQYDSGYKFIDFGSATMHYGNWANPGDFNGKYYYFLWDGSWINYMPSGGAISGYLGGDITSQPSGQFTITTDYMTAYTNSANASKFTALRLCDSNISDTSTPTSTSTSTPTSTPVTPGANTETPTSTPTPAANHFYTVYGEVLNSSSDFDTSNREYILSNDFHCGSGDLLAAQNLAFGVWASGSGEVGWFTSPGYSSSHGLGSNLNGYSEIYSQLNSQNNNAYLVDTLFTRDQISTQATNLGLDVISYGDYRSWYSNESNLLPQYSSVTAQCGNSGDCNTTRSGVAKAYIKLLCYGNHQPPPPSYGVCNNTGIWKTIDVLTQGTLTNGTMTAFNLSPSPSEGVYATDKISFDFTLDLPANLMTGYKEGWLAIDMGGNYGPNFPTDANPGFGTHLDFTVNINDSEFTIKDITDTGPAGFDDTNKIALHGDVAHLEIHVETTYANQYTDRNNYYALAVRGLKLKVLLGDACLFNTLNDGGMEWHPDSPYWGLSDASKIFGRYNSIVLWQAFTDGFPACGDGWHGISNSEGAIEEPFTWDGGTAYWKVRYRSGKVIFLGSDVPSVFLSDSVGNLTDLVGDGHWNNTSANHDWTLLTGSAYLSAGNYKIHLDRGCDYNGMNRCTDAFGAVLYDDIAVGHIPQDGTCDEMIYNWPENEPTPTPTPTAPTPTGTRVTGTTTVMASLEATGTPTGTVSATWIKSPIAETTTPRPTGTLVHTATPYTLTPTKSQTPWGNGNTQTPDPYHKTSTAQGTPNPGGTPDPNMPPVIGEDGTPIPGMDPWQPGPQVECIRPSTVWDIAWWIDYERCLLYAFVSFGPSQIATVQAIPTLFASKEPFNTVGQARNAIVGMQTEVATMQWANTGMSGVNAPVSADDPVHILKPLNPGQTDPWSGIGRFTINLGSRNPVLTTYCSNQLSGYFSKYLGDGLCYVLNLTMAIGYLPWIQMLINLLCVWGIIKQGLGVINYFGGGKIDGLTDTISRTWKKS